MINDKLPKPLNSLQFEQQFPNVRQRVVHAGKIALNNIVQSMIGSLGTADFSAGSVLNLSSHVEFNIPNQNKPFFGNVYVSVYQGTTLTQANQIYPNRGSGVAEGRYKVQGWYDGFSWDRIGNVWKGNITDTNGTSAQAITFTADWSYLDYTFGTVT